MERAQSQAIKGLGEGLKHLGYQERKNLFFETRNVKGNRAALQPAASELLARNVTVIFTTGTSATRAAMAATREVPIVFVHPGDPVGAGLVKSAAEQREKSDRSSGLCSSLTPNSVSCFLKKSIPELQKTSGLLRRQQQLFAQNFDATEAAAKKFGLQVVGYGIKSADELKTTLGSVRGEPGAGIFQFADDLFESESEFLFATARAKKLPTMFNEEAWAIQRRASRLRARAISIWAARRGRLASTRSSRATPAASLPIERASKFDLTLNYRTANFHRHSFLSGNVEKSGQSHSIVAHRHGATLADTIRSIPIFSGLSREDVAKVLGKMEEIIVRRRSDDFFARRSRRRVLSDSVRRGAGGVGKRRGKIGSRRHPWPARLVRRNGSALRRTSFGDDSYGQGNRSLAPAARGLGRIDRKASDLVAAVLRDSEQTAFPCRSAIFDRPRGF